MFKQLAIKLNIIQAKPRWLLLFLMLALVSVVVEILMHPYSVQSVLHHLPSSATNQDKLVVTQTLDQGLFARAAFLPIRLLFGWATFALMLYYICGFLIPRKIFRFIQIFSLEVSAEAILILAKAAALLQLVINSPNPGSRIFIPLSCVDFIPTHDYSTFTFLNSLNVFTVGYIAILTMGISVVCRISKIKALFIVGIVWGISALFNIGIITVLRDRLHLLVN